MSDPTAAEVDAVMRKLYSTWNWLYSWPYNPALQKAAAGLSTAYQGLIDWCYEHDIELDDDNLPTIGDS